jgi:hypothetical protein
MKRLIKLKNNSMKKLLLLTAIVITASCVSGQKSIDALFERYAGKEGFTTVTIDGNLFKLAACLDENEKENHIPANITQIRILSQEDDNMNVVNFYDLVIKDIDLENYEEFMRVKDSDQDLRMLVRSEGNKFKEFLLIAGGEDNAVIQIKGNMTLAEAKKISGDAKKNHGLNISASLGN